MKKRILIPCTVFLLLFAAFALFIKLHYFNAGETVVFEIAPGQTASQVAQNLKEAGISKGTTWVKIILKRSSSAKDLRAGKYDLRKNMASESVLNCIKSGRCLHLAKITTLEGWRSEEIAEVLAANDITDPQAFLDIVRKRDLEGYLFPSTYHFSEHTPAWAVVDAMVGQYNKTVKPLFAQYPTDLTEKEVLTLASIVEREAIFHDERPKIAAVYLNRLKIGKRLEADPTVQYALGFNFRENRYWKKGLTYRDLRNSSPYNTYRYNGLPPGPIANPSYESVKAVLNPQPDFDALYFVADNTGRHDFSRTYNEHLIKKNKYRRKK